MTRIAVVLASIVAVPFVAFAQDASLSATIRAEIMKDPRSADIAPEQIDALVAALTQAAQEEGVTERDILWRPAEARVSQEPSCGFLCRVNEVFGFGGRDYTVPVGLGIASAILILFLTTMYHRHHEHGVEPSIEAIHDLPPTKNG